MKHYRCSGIKKNGARCWYRSVVKRNKRWWCRRHDPDLGKPDPIPVAKLKKIQKMVLYYEEHGELGRGVDFEKLWADTVPNLLQEIFTLRKIKS